MSTGHVSHDHPPRPWTPVIFLLLGLIPLYWYLSKGHWPTLFQREERAVTLGPGVTDWYLTVKMPEAPSDLAALQMYKDRLSGWLSAITREGFHPILLSDIQDRIGRAEGLPDRSIVLVFEPGMATTYQAAAPLLRWHKTPAVWITNEAAVKRRDRKYVSNFKLWQMRRSGMWDVGSYESANVLKLKGGTNQTVRFGTESKPVWKPAAVTQAMNRAKSLVSLNRLKVSTSWTDEEFISRLLHEVPVQGTSQLVYRQVGERSWGIAMPGVAYTGALFNVKAPLDKRAGSLSWPATQGILDFDLQLDVASVVGELWLFLRSDRSTGKAVRVGFLPGMLLIESANQNKRERILQVALGSLMQNNKLSTTLSLRDNRLTVQINGRHVADSHLIPAPSSKDSMLEMIIYNRIRGTASADGIRMIYTPVFQSATTNE